MSLLELELIICYKYWGWVMNEFGEFRAVKDDYERDFLNIIVSLSNVKERESYRFDSVAVSKRSFDFIKDHQKFVQDVMSFYMGEKLCCVVEHFRRLRLDKLVSTRTIGYYGIGICVSSNIDDFFRVRKLIINDRELEYLEVLKESLRDGRV